MLSPAFAFAQRQTNFITLTDAQGKLISGDVAMKGYEKSISINTLTTGGKSNSQLTLTMGIQGAAADLRRIMVSNEMLASGQLYVTQQTQSSVLRPTYTIKMENMQVVSCTEALGCDNNMTLTVVLQAARIGWTYYKTTGSGPLSVTNKYGFDTESGKEWNNF